MPEEIPERVEKRLHKVKFFEELTLMEPADHRLNSKSSQPANLQALSIYYRHFFCRNCKLPVNVCNTCERGQIYCSECKLLQRQERIQKARNKYKKTRQGRLLRAASSQRRRNKIKVKKEQANLPEFLEPQKNEGDRGLTLPQVSNTTPQPVILAEQKNNGVFQDVQFPNPIFNYSTGTSERLARKTPNIFCTFCNRECAPFQRQKKGRLGAQEKKDFQRWRARSRDKDP